jgi:dihydroorotase
MVTQKYLHRCAAVILFLFCMQHVAILRAQQIDILLKGGHVIDPKNKIDSKMDV